MHINDIVSRKSYNHDILFKIIDIKENKAILHGLNFRLIADSDISDLEKVNIMDLENAYMRGLDDENNLSSKSLFKNWYMHQCSGYIADTYINKEYSFSNTEKNFDKKFGKILHIDGDKFYLKECLQKYHDLGVSCIGISIEESKQPEMILELLKEHKPNILVITGHDSIIKDKEGLSNINYYTNSKYYLESVKIAREYNHNYDELVIFAGGCKSHYEALIDAGANFATSPNRVLIHVTDPVIVACNIAKASVREFLDIESIVKNTSAGLKGIGGFETRGQCREYKPEF